jgi:predicted metalloprotease with PDZ domain
MLSRTRAVILAVLVAAASAAGVPAQTQDAVSYRLTFPERVHRLMDVEVTFTRLPAAPLELRMSRSSPGRYALHEFAKNVFGLSATDGEGRPLVVTRPDPYGWEVATHPGTVQVRYRVFGDRVDGTYLGVDSTHAHINMPAALLWARGLDARPAQVRVEPPPGSNWRVATQLLPDGRDGFSFRAPNFQYLMDSPTEVSDHRVRSFMPGGTDGPTEWQIRNLEINEQSRRVSEQLGTSHPVCLHAETLFLAQPDRNVVQHFGASSTQTRIVQIN